MFLLVHVPVNNKSNYNKISFHNVCKLKKAKCDFIKVLAILRTLLVKVDELGKPKWMGHFLQLGQNKGRLKIHFPNKENTFL